VNDDIKDRQASTPRHALRRPGSAAHARFDAPVIFRQDFRDLPAFRETVRIRGWNGLHLRAPGRTAAADTWFMTGAGHDIR